MVSMILNVILIIMMIYPFVNGECTLKCGDNGGRCLETHITTIPEICACPDGSFTNASCQQLANETQNENENITALNIHSRRLIAVCEHSFCGNVGICIIIDATFACICPDGTIADTCNGDTDTRIQSIVPYCTGCLNNGVCNVITGTCVCPSGYSGTQCELFSPAELCRDITCRNGGVCNVLSPTYAACWCLLGFHGDFCERRSVASRCSSFQCVNGGTCYEHSPASSIFAYCLCKPGFTGSRCEYEYFRCPANGCYADAYGCAQGKYFECVETAIITSRKCPRGLRYNFFLNRCDYTANVACPAL